MRMLRLPAWPAREFQSSLPEHRPALDGIRGLAILLVLLYDCLKLPAGDWSSQLKPLALIVRKVSAAGWLGVDLFFVLSGCLITGILLDTAGQRGFLKSFYLRRALRIFPLYYLALCVTFFLIPVVLPHWSPSEKITVLAQDQWWFWTYLQNWHFIGVGDWPEIHYLNHFWSLAIEEQFYLVWPLVVGCCSRKNLTRLCVALIAIAFSLRVGLWSAGAPAVTLHVMTFTRMDSLCLGALVAVGLRSERCYHLLKQWAWPAVLGILGVVIAIDLMWPLLQSGSSGAQTLGHTLLGAAFAGIIFCASALKQDHWLSRVLSHRWLTIWGQYSYAIYVMHRPLYRLVLKIDFPLQNETALAIAVFVSTLVLSLLAAAISWRYFEQPLLSLKSHFPRPDQVSPAEPRTPARFQAAVET